MDPRGHADARRPHGRDEHVVARAEPWIAAPAAVLLLGLGGEDVGEAAGGEHSIDPRAQSIGIRFLEPGRYVGGQRAEALLQ